MKVINGPKLYVCSMLLTVVFRCSMALFKILYVIKEDYVFAYKDVHESVE
jgi:hypothetical protein